MYTPFKYWISLSCERLGAWLPSRCGGVVRSVDGSEERLPWWSILEPTLVIEVWSELDMTLVLPL